MTETERKHSIEALTSGAMAETWAWVQKKLPPGAQIFDAHAHIGADVDGRTMTADGMRERMLAAGVKVYRPWSSGYRPSLRAIPGQSTLRSHDAARAARTDTSAWRSA